MDGLIPLYFPIKIAHICFAVLTISLFNIQYYWRLLKPDHPPAKVLLIMPHINDTFLLLSGIMLSVIGDNIPFISSAPWLNLKLVLLVAYVLFAICAIHMQPGTVRNKINYVLAMVCFIGMVGLAVIKPLLWS